MKAELYSKPYCTFCDQAKALLERKGIEFTVVDVMAGTPEENEAARTSLIERVTEITGDAPRTMPQIFVDGTYVGGYKELNEMLKAA